MDAVSAALRAVPRAGFLPRGARFRAGYDGPITIGHGQTNSQPRTVEQMLRLLKVRAGDKVLDVGSGSGWTTALLAHLTGPDGSVIGVELVPKLAEWGAANLARTSYDWASIRGRDPGCARLARVRAVRPDPGLGRRPVAPQQLVEQLADEGLLVVPVRGTMTLGIRRGSELETSEHGSYRFVPLL